jgi:hypothetical protein
MRALRTERLLPADLHIISISEALKKSEMMTDPVLEERDTHCNWGYKHEPLAYRKYRRQDMDNLNKKIGLCLHCIILKVEDADCKHPSH